jgi:hypothetical protein
MGYFRQCIDEELVGREKNSIVKYCVVQSLQIICLAFSGD